MNTARLHTVYPLSHGQRGIWLQCRLAPESPVYNFGFAARVWSEVDVAALREACQTLIDRHPALRATFTEQDGEPVQEIHLASEVHFEQVDASGWSQTDLRARVVEAHRVPFDLERGPVMRVALFTRGEQDHVLLLSFHHLSTDGTSYGILLHELSLLYVAAHEGGSAELPPVAGAYEDYVRWERERLNGSEGERLWNYWQKQLGGELSALELTTDRPRPPTQTYRGGAHPFAVDTKLTSKIKALARAEDATLFTTLLAAFQVLLHRYTGQEEVAVSAPTAGAGRRVKEFAQTVGCYVNPVVLRADLSGDPSFRDFLHRMRSTVSKAVDHSGYPYPLLVEQLIHRRDRSRSPLSQANFSLIKPHTVSGVMALSYTDAEDVEADFGGLELRPFLLAQQEGLDELCCELFDANATLTGFLKYNSDLFEEETICRMGGHFRTLLEGIVADPERKVSELPLLTEAERQRILVEWHGTQTDYPRDRCIHQLFEEQAEETPDAVAVVFGEERLTYHELNERANRLAHHLRKLGVGPEMLAGICVERSLEMIVGLLGILKAGGAYVPLDPEYPQERLAFMVEDARAAVVLVHDQTRGRLPASTARSVCLDRERPAIAQEPSESLPIETTPKDLAYVMYTSGSTGMPKGVAVVHRNVVRLVKETDYAHLDSGEVLLQFAPLAFDASTFEIWGALLNGGRLAIAPPGRLSLEELGEVVCRAGVTTLWLTAGLFHLMVDRQISSLNNLRQLLAGGDVLSPDHVRKALERLEGVQLINGYGPTEGVTFSCCFAFPKAGWPNRPAPIGRPIANTQVYILDAHRQPVPIGVAGELYLGGDGVARGYFNRPELTAEKFIANPFRDAPEARLYKTGDLCRWLPDGNIEYLGRIDHQVKLRGFRIELGEIESRLAQHTAVKECVVAVREGEVGDKRLVAYVVAKGAAGGGAGVREALKAHLKQSLPEYMVPAVFVFLEALPLTPNGKVDRKALPEPREGDLFQEAYVAPRTERERVLARIWSDLLGVERVGLDDNFFALGGDSIISIQMVSRAARAGLALTVKQVFERQTLGELARAAGRVHRVVAEQGVIEGEIALTPILHWFFDRSEVDYHHFNQSVLLDLSPEIELVVLDEALAYLAAHHDVLRLRFTKDASRWRGMHAPVEEGAFPLEIVDLSGLSEEEAAAVLEGHANRIQASLNLEAGPLARAVWFASNGRAVRLLLVIHHLVVDGVSWRILLEDLERACRQLMEGEAVELPPKTTAFRDWSRRLAAWVDSDELAEEKAYWLETTSREVVALPTDHAFEATQNTVGSTRSVTVSLTARETKALLQEVPEAYRTEVNDLLLAALTQALCESLGTECLKIDLEGHGREELFEVIDLSRTVGWFTSVFPVVLERTAEEQGTLLKSIKEQLRSIPRRGIGYGVLRYLSGDEATRQALAEAAPAEIAFNYLGQLDAGAFASGLLRPAAAGEMGASAGAARRRDHLLEITGMVSGGRLQMEWSYSEAIHERATVAAWAAGFQAALRALIEHCTQPESWGRTPSDYPLAPLNQREVDRLLAESRKIEDLYPLSPLQHGLLFHTLHESGAGAYVVQLELELEGDLNEAAFHSAWQTLVDRHPILRSGFVFDGVEAPVQVVHAEAELPWRAEDWRTLDADGPKRHWEELLTADLREGFVLDRPPLMRCALVRLAEQRWRLLFSNHHALMDGWCLPILFRELLAFYEAGCRGEKTLLPAPPFYRDYIAWLQRQDRQAAERFWREELAGFTAPTRLGIDSPGGATGGANEKQVIEISESFSARLRTFAHRHRVTLNTLVQGAWALLLHRYSGEDDVVFGVTSAGRPPELEGVEEAIGPFIRTLPARARLTGEETALSLLERLQERQTARELHGHVGLTEIQGWSDVPRGTPLFENLFVFENYPHGAPSERDASLRISGIQGNNRTHYPLLLIVLPGERLELRLAYNADRFGGEAIARLLGHVRTLLEGIVADPDRKIVDLPLLTAAERQRILVEWNDTQTDYPSDKCIHQLFEEQVERAPDAAAAVFEEERLTYRELNTRANRLARHLRTLGVGPEVVVGICVERSLEMIVGLLGILKAGGAYVPLDPEYPQERLTFMVEDARVPVVLVHDQTRGRLPASTARIVCLDADWEAIDRGPSHNPPVETTPENLAYVIYTSGSTGRPKGVSVTHRPIVRLVCNTNYVELRPSDRIAQAANASFDAATFEIWGALAHGGAMVVVGKETVLSPADFAAFLYEQKITTLFLTTALFNEMVRQASEAFRRLRHLLFGGEAVDVGRVRSALAGAPPERLLHVYGPTESVTFATWHLVEEVLEGATTVPIGRPLANTRAYLLDRHLQPVPVGVAGELYIGGDALARGYFNRPELTAEKFIADPFRDDPEARLYKTGDLCRWLPDGNIEFLGRIDHQVKLRGFRIELGEIESRLAQHTAVKECVVVVRASEMGEKRLVAYVVAKGAAREEAELRAALKSHLRHSLPEYMVPELFVFLASLPLSPNGKIDRKALPEPREGDLFQEAYVAPRTEKERRLAAIWSGLLGIERVGLDDNFFALGGDSIISIQMVSRAAQAGLSLTVRQVFEHQTLGALARAAGEAGRVVVEPGPVEGEIVLTPILRWFFAQSEIDSHHFNQSVLLELFPEIQPDLLEGALASLAAHHDVLRLRFTKDASRWRGMHASVEEGAFPLEIVDLSGLSEEEAAAVLEGHANRIQASLNLEAGPLARAVWFASNGRAVRLLLVIHHLVVDGVSWRILLEDLERACRQLMEGEAVELPPKTTAFRDWSRRLAAWVDSDELAEEKAYWLETTSREVVALPTDHAFEATQNTVGSTRSVTVSLTARETKALLQEVPEAYRTEVNDLLLAALTQALCEQLETDSIRIDLEGHGREELFEEVDLSRTVGWFTSVYPVVLERTSEEPGTLLKSIKEQLRAIPRKGIGYGALRWLSGDEGTRQELAEAASEEIVFNYLGQFDAGSSASSRLRRVEGEMGRPLSPARLRDHLIEITGMVSGGRLQMEWSYSEAIHERATVAAWAAGFQAALRALIEHCTQPESWGRTPSDYPLAPLNQREVDRLLAESRKIEDLYPLSPLQHGLLFHTLHESGAGAYVVQLELELEGDLEESALQAAWQTVVDRHAALRSGFVLEGVEKSVQSVHAEVELPWSAEDWRAVGETEQEERWRALLASDRRVGFALVRPPLMRCTLVRLDAQRWRLLFSNHHALMDGWCLPILFREVLTLYEVGRRGEKKLLPAPRPYRDYIGWLQRQDRAAAERYWREELSGFGAPTPLGIDRTQERAAEGRHGERVAALSHSLTARLNGFARRHRVTLSTLFQAAWSILLHRYSG